MPCERNELSHYTCSNIHEQHQGHAKHDRVSASQQRPARCVTSPGITAHGRDASRAAVWHVGRRVDEYCMWWSSSKKLLLWLLDIFSTLLLTQHSMKARESISRCGITSFIKVKYMNTFISTIDYLTQTCFTAARTSQDDKSKGLRDDWLGGKRFLAFLKAENRTRHATHSNK